jgi:hypothetical protein
MIDLELDVLVVFGADDASFLVVESKHDIGVKQNMLIFIVMTALMDAFYLF